MSFVPCAKSVHSVVGAAPFIAAKACWRVAGHEGRAGARASTPALKPA